ncbi:MAG: hypothetical protein HKL96_07640 [Phycisphaerales bacterium]|nr:hypothetical protein [Phycisphaerales bacterium]
MLYSRPKRRGRPLLFLLAILTLMLLWVIWRNVYHSYGPRSPDDIYNIQSFGAKGDGLTLDTAAIQKAVNTCAHWGGGTVLVPPGIYLTGTIVLASHVTLYLKSGAELLGSKNMSDYRLVSPFRDSGKQRFGYCVVGADHATAIRIQGHGIINGNGLGFKGSRPFLVRLAHCRDVVVRDVTLTQSAAWGLVMFQCQEVLVQSVHIYNHANVNNDGIDIDSSQGIHVTNCDINTEDDSVCLKTTTSVPTAYILVDHCRLSSDCAAMKLGSESRGPFSHITFAYDYVYNTKLGGIKIHSADGAVVSDIHFDHIVMRNVDMPIYMRLNARCTTFHPGQKPLPPGSISDITISNLDAVESPVGKLTPSSGIFLYGMRGHRIGLVALYNVHIVIPGGGTAANRADVIKDNPNVYPDYNNYGAFLPAWGIFVRHLNDLWLADVHLQLAHPDARPEAVYQRIGHVLDLANMQPINR